MNIEDATVNELLIQAIRNGTVCDLCCHKSHIVHNKHCMTCYPQSRKGFKLLELDEVIRENIS